jgi:hypothetical protein
MLVKEFDSVLKPEGGRIVYLGTPQVEESLYNVLVRERGYSVRVWPAEIPKRIDVYGGSPRAFIVKPNGERRESWRSHRAHKVLGTISRPASSPTVKQGTPFSSCWTLRCPMWSVCRSS